MRDRTTDSAARNTKNLLFGVVLVGAGSLFLINGWDSFDYLKWWYYVPAFIALYGLIDIVVGRTAKLIGKGCFNIIFAFWLFASIEHLWGWTFKTSWPLILIAFGVQSIVSGLLSSHKENE